LQVQQARLLDVEQQFENGLATKLTVAQSRAQVDATRVQLITAEGDLRNGRHTLALVIGLPWVPNPLVDDVVVPETIEPEEDYEQVAVANRQDLLAAAQALEAAQRGVDAAIAEYYPSVTLNVAGFLYREHYADASKWEAILSANLPIFSAGLIEADVRTAWSRVRQAALSESSIKRNVLHDVQVAYENLRTSGRRIVNLRDEVSAAEDAYHQAEGAYQNGLGINLDVLSAQEQWLDSQLQLTAALYDHSIFYLDLVRATGQLAYGIQART
jgi:outer membrane protein TolC